ncbi:MAG TPA: hypothetical protein VJX10_22575 [Pseudonocardiaceae bacterium]|nr:hypothetical protein [Pseudonocardiaceae bacterium]
MGTGTTPAEPLPGLVGFTHALRRAGLPCDTHRTAAYLDAVGRLDLADPASLYWAGRVTLCAQPDDLPAYDEAFAAWFSPNWRPPTPAAPADDGPTRTPMTASVLPAAADSTTADGERTAIPTLAPSDVEVLRHRNISELSAE